MILLEKLNREHTFKIMLITPAINLTGVLYLYNMKLIEYINYEIKVSDEALLVKPIRDLYRADKSKTKETFYTQCSIIFFMADPRSSYAYIVDENERFDLIKKQEGLADNYKITKELQSAIDVYKELSKTVSSQLLKDTYIAIDKVREFLRNVDLTLVDDKGKPVYTVNTITATIKQIPQLAKDIMEAEKQVNADILELGRKRGGNEGKALFEDGFNFS